MKTYGLIGHPLSHSFSRSYFTKKFQDQGIEAAYVNFDLDDPGKIKAVLDRTDISGLNVTIPYKRIVLALLDEIDEDASAIGAVNTIAFKNGRTIGYNTDVIGFRNAIKPFLNSKHHRALVLGSGGASLAVIAVLNELGVEHMVVSREPKDMQIGYDQLTEQVVANHPFIINTTPVGMHPHINGLPDMDYNGVGKDHFLYDLIYNPEETRFMCEGKARGAAVSNGHDMLVQQAEASWRIWNS